MTTNKETKTMTTTPVNPVAARVEERLKILTPNLLALAVSTVSDVSHPAVEAPADVMRALHAGPPPDELVAKGLRLLAETAHDLADALDPE